MIEINEAGFASLTAKISRERGFKCGSYTNKCLQRRIAVRMRANSTRSFAEYAKLLDSDPAEYARLLSALTINVTKFFRNWDTWNVIARKVIPDLWAHTPGSIHVWSAGCASGEEPYSLAALFCEHAAHLGERRRLGRVHIFGTDIDTESLEAAQAATFGEAAFSDTPAWLRERYFPQSGKMRGVAPAVRRLVTFRRSDLLQDHPPHQGLHLIVCRNVIIYFEREAQDKLLRGFRDSLRPGGFLVLGKVETLLGENRHWFKPVNSRERIFTKP